MIRMYVYSSVFRVLWYLYLSLANKQIYIANLYARTPPRPPIHINMTPRCCSYTSRAYMQTRLNQNGRVSRRCPIVISKNVNFQTCGPTMVLKKSVSRVIVMMILLGFGFLQGVCNSSSPRTFRENKITIKKGAPQVHVEGRMRAVKS